MIDHILAAVPPEIAGVPTWALNGLTIGSLVSMVLMGLFTSKLWTKRQVDELVKQHEREIQALKDRYELHLTRTVELYQGRVDDALKREQERRGEAREWQDISRQWESTAQMLAQGLEPLQDQSEAMLRIVTAWQTEAAALRRRELGS